MLRLPSLVPVLIGLCLACGGAGTEPVVSGPELVQLEKPAEIAVGAKAFPLEDGSVVVLGGPPNRTSSPVVGQVYRPDSDTWFRLAEPSFPPWAATTAQLDDGRIAVVNHFDRVKRLTEGDEARISAWRPEPLLELFDPETNSWSRGATPPGSSTADHLSALPGGDLLLFGCHQHEPYMARYAAASDSWSSLDASTVPERACGALSVVETSQGPLLWERGNMPLHWFDAGSGAWKQIDNAVANTSVVADAGSVGVVVIPFTTPESQTPSASVLNPKTETWRQTAAMPDLGKERWRPGATWLRGGRLFVVGGQFGVPPQCHDGVINLALDSLQWSVLEPLSEPRDPGLIIAGPGEAAVALGGKTLDSRGRCRGAATAPLDVSLR